MKTRSLLRFRLEMIEARITNLKWKVEMCEVGRKEVIEALDTLGQQVRNTHADFVEEEAK